MLKSRKKLHKDFAIFKYAGSEKKQSEHLALKHQKNLIISYYGDHDLSMIVYSHTRPCHSSHLLRH